MAEGSQVIYVTEPEVIDLQAVRQLLPAEYELVAGKTDFSSAPADCSTLLIRSATTIDSSIKQHFPELKSVIRIGTGVDNIDMEFCKQAGVEVFTAAGANADAVSDYVVGMMLFALRRLQTLTPEDVKTWNRFKFTGHSMSAQTIGIIGFGHIGRLVHQKLQGFGCQFFAYDPLVKKEDLPEGVTGLDSVDEVLQRSSIVTLHLPLMPETRDLLNQRNLSLLKPGAILLNSSRGGIVNEADVVEAAHSGLTYIADTVEHEPTPNPILLGEPNIILTPHIASLTEESSQNMLKVALANFLKTGRPKIMNEYEKFKQQYNTTLKGLADK